MSAIAERKALAKAEGPQSKIKSGWETATPVKALKAVSHRDTEITEKGEKQGKNLQI